MGRGLGPGAGSLTHHHGGRARQVISGPQFSLLANVGISMESVFFQGSLAVELLLQLNIYGSLSVKEGKPSGRGLRGCSSSLPVPPPAPALSDTKGGWGTVCKPTGLHSSSPFFDLLRL